MTRTLRYLLLVVLVGLSGSVIAQEISGRVLDEKKEPLPSAIVQVLQGGILKGGAAADLDGNYTVKPLDAGFYDVMVIYAGLDTSLTTGVIVSPGQRTTINVSLKRRSQQLKQINIIAYKKPLVDQDKPSSTILTKAEIETVPTNEITDLVALAPGVYQSQRGGATYIGGARSDGTTYIIDGVVVQGTTGINMSQGGVDQVEVIVSGVPANYGDFSGGVVNITSRGVSQKFTGDIRAQHSIDGYNNNLASFSIAGPLYKKRMREDSTRKKPVLGFALSGDFYDDNDRYPTYNEQYVAKGSVLQALEANPLKVVSDNSGNYVYNPAADYVTLSGLQQTKIPPNNVTKEARLGGKLDYQVTDNVHLVAGGNFDYTSQDQYNRSAIMFAPQSIPVLNTFTGRGFLRFTQKFGKLSDTSNSHGIISNAYYSVQADYQKLYQGQEDPTFKHNIFDYAYVGKFTESRSNEYLTAQTDSISGKVGTVLYQSVDNGITYTPSNMNPYLANYTKEYYNSLNGILPTQLTQIQAVGAIANGDEPFYTNGLFLSPGSSITGYSFFNSNQYSLTVDASFDLQTGKTKHAIEFGLYYQQRIEKSFSATANYLGSGTVSLYSLMRGLVSNIDNGNLVLDKANPIFIVNGQHITLSQLNSGNYGSFGPTDTIYYNYKNVGSGQNNNLGSQFDQNLRKELGLGPDADINIDALDPSKFSLGMFTADELLNSGNPFVNYQGYSFTGGPQTGTVSFNDFWTQKDANGNYTRPIAAFSPNYIAGYILDKFNYKDIHFNIGVRIDRYDANTNVLIDPYSEYAEETINQVPGTYNTFNNGQHPANLGGNTVVYVADNTASTPTIVGYRSGTNWYDPNGNYVSDPSVLTQYSGGRDPQPEVVKNAQGNVTPITDPNYNPNSAFTAYTPQVTVMPRISFNFPISDVADFYGHYDVYSQRPTTGIDATAYDYYYLAENNNIIINNANLKPQSTVDYEVGFQQKLSDHSALTLSAYYKERKNMIALQPYLYAYPTTYYTYGNRDFSTTDGTTIKYDLRATNHLSMTLSYTLQFAEGTGSTPYSTNSGGGGQISPNGLLQSFIEAGLPNLRYVTALDYDSRHNIVANINYRYADGEGPIVDGLNILQNAGIDLIGRARSGEPYTRYSDALGNTVDGGINGSRLPWHYGIDLRVDKDFALTSGKKHKDALAGVKAKRPLYLKGIIQVNNLLNTRDILGVYGYTGKPDDNGYLTSSYGAQYVPQQISPKAYADQYAIAYNNPANLNYARTISFALQFDF